MSFLETMPERAQQFLAANNLPCAFDVVQYDHLAFDEHGWFGQEHADGLAAIASALTMTPVGAIPPRCAIEVGCWLGKSTRYLSTLFEYVIAVDHWQGSVEHQPDRNRDDTRDRLPILFEQFLANAAHEGRRNIVPVRRPSEVALSSIAWPDDVDLIYIDGSHDYESVWQDVFGYSELLSSRGVICGDDYELPSVAEAVQHVANLLTMRVNVVGTFWAMTPDVEGRLKQTRRSGAELTIKKELPDDGPARGADSVRVDPAE